MVATLLRHIFESGRSIRSCGNRRTLTATNQFEQAKFVPQPKSLILKTRAAAGRCPMVSAQCPRLSGSDAVRTYDGPCAGKYNKQFLTAAAPWPMIAGAAGIDHAAARPIKRMENPT
jgi:hypothetical protein